MNEISSPPIQDREEHLKINSFSNPSFFILFLKVCLPKFVVCSRATLYRALGHVVSDTPLAAVMTESRKVKIYIGKNLDYFVHVKKSQSPHFSFYFYFHSSSEIADHLLHTGRLIRSESGSSEQGHGLWLAVGLVRDHHG